MSPGSLRTSLGAFDLSGSALRINVNEHCVLVVNNVNMRRTKSMRVMNKAVTKCPAVKNFGSFFQTS